MPYYCTVPRCTSMAGKAKNVSFHQFPRDEELAKLWNKILKRGKPYTKYSKVCSLHFTPEDYTITSVGKNKGQWRTLRKDAIPSQNLPSESPTPYQRKQWGSWAHTPPANVLDPNIQQQVAQAIYMQTMLAMQAAGTTEVPSFNHTNGLPLPLPMESFAQTSSTPDTDILKGKQTNTEAKSTSYKCTECSKCFKDPDVFILHKRSHIKNEKNEKENFNLNLTLQANPILANLLKTNTENSNIFDNNLISMESLLMTALAANMENYVRNFTSMMKGENRDLIDHDRGQMDHDRGDLDHEHDDLGHDRDNMDNRNGMDHDDGESDFDRTDDRLDLSNRGIYEQNNLDLRIVSFNKDCQSASEKSASNQNSSLGIDKEISNHNVDEVNCINGQMDHNNVVMNQDRVSNPINCDNNIFQSRLIEHYRNNTYDRDICYNRNREINNSNFQNGQVGKFNQGAMDHSKDLVDHKKGWLEHEKAMMNDNRPCDDDVTNYDDDSQSSHDEQICDSDLNESIDSNKLVIDENA